MALVPPLVIQEGSDPSTVDAVGIVHAWLDAFEDLIKSQKFEDLGQLFAEECWWKDNFALTWDVRAIQGLAKVTNYVKSNIFTRGLFDFKTPKHGAAAPKLIQRGPMTWVESMYDFETKLGRGRGVLRLANTKPGEWKAWCITTYLHEIKGHEEKVGLRRPNGVTDAIPQQHHQNGHTPKSPAVVIIGAGQCGLAVAARLQAMDISYLVVDQADRVGNGWRSRYSVLRGHTPIWADNMPYLPMPSNWPFYVPKEMYADWIESYAKLMNLDVQLSTTLKSSTFDRTKRQWTIELDQRGDITTLNPRHIVLATGIHSAIPDQPHFLNEEKFRGKLYHSGYHTSATIVPDLSSKKIALIGTSTSSHDIAADFYDSGAKSVTMIQRGATGVMGAKAAMNMLHPHFLPESGYTLEEADVIANSNPMAVMVQMMAGAVKGMAMQDKELHDGLANAGFEVDTGAKPNNFMQRQFRERFGRFYINMGTSNMIAEGKIKVKRSPDGIKEFVEDGIILETGEKVEADIVVVCTGFKQMNDNVRNIMGDDVASKVQPIWGMDHEGELNHLFRPSGYPGFWACGGFFAWARQKSRDIAVQIKAVEVGMNDEHWDQ